MKNRNMQIFEMVLKEDLVSLSDLQMCWEAANQDLRFAQHKDLAKVIVAKKFLTKEECTIITNKIDNIIIAEPENTDKFFKRMQELSNRLEKIKFKKATQKIDGVSNFKIKPVTDKLARTADSGDLGAGETKIKLKADTHEQNIGDKDLDEVKSKVNKVISQFSIDEEKLDIDSEPVSKKSNKTLYVVGIIVLLAIILGAIFFTDILI
ncbi:MAG: hypothetical protein K8S87_11535 [Planctomycetes bacterium]|nr:hypothetical protein [Planctomycetota bacterium]